MNKHLTRVLSLVLCVLMCASLLPVPALAADEGVFDSPALFAVSNSKPRITTQPKSKSAYEGDSVSFKVAASGKNLKYQWFYRTSSSGKWTKYSGKTKATLKLTAAKKNNGYQYRCKVSRGSSYVYSKTVTLKVNLVKYRALLIGEVNFSPTCLRNKGDVLNMKSMLNSVNGAKGRSWSVTCAYNKSPSKILSLIKSTLGAADKNDVSLFFIATHGVADTSYGDYAGALATVTSGGTEDFLTLPALADALKAVKGKVIVFVESCGSGAAIYNNGVRQNGADSAAAFNDSVIRAFAARDEIITDYSQDGASANLGDFRTSKFYVLTASEHMELSWGFEGPTAADSYNVFTYWLVDGVQGAMPADTNNNNKVTLKELYNYIKKNEASMAEQHVQVYPASSSYVLFKKR